MKDNRLYKDLVIRHDKAHNRFVANDQESNAFVQYEHRKRDLWIITSLFVQESLGHKEMKERLIKKLLSYARLHHIKVIPLASEVKRFFLYHPAWNDLIYG